MQIVNARAEKLFKVTSQATTFLQVGVKCFQSSN